MKKAWLLILCCGALLAACEVKPLDGQKELAREAEMHKVKRITEEQIYAAAFKAGDTITTVAAGLLHAQVSKALVEQDLQTAMKFCKPEQYPAVMDLAAKYQATVSRTSQRLRNPDRAAKSLTAQLLDAYAYNSERQLPLDPNVQRAGKDRLIYTRPIVLQESFCLRCHGTVGTDLTKDEATQIKTAYPKDQALGYQTGQLRGMWVVEFRKDGLARSISEQLPKRKWGKKKTKEPVSS